MREFLDHPLIESRQLTLTVSSLIFVILTIIIAILLTIIIRKLLHRKAENKSISNAGRYYAFAQLTQYFIFTIAIVVILDSIGFNMTMFTAGSAALLVGLGFGLQHTFNDFVSGIILLFEGTLQVGNIVEIQSIVGRVKHIGMRTSKIETRDGVTIIVPNSRLVSDNVVNWSHQHVDRTRFTIRFCVGVQSDVKKVREILLSIAKTHVDVVPTPAPKVRLYDFNDSGYVIDLQFWTSNMFFVETVKSDIRFRIVEEFEKQDIRISFPHREVVLEKRPG